MRRHSRGRELAADNGRDVLSGVQVAHTRSGRRTRTCVCFHEDVSTVTAGATSGFDLSAGHRADFEPRAG